MAYVRMHSPPARTVKRPNQRWDRQRPSSRGAGPNDDHGAPDPSPGLATGATAGIPGTWTPTGALPPASVTELAQGIPVTVVANPATAWTSGQYVQTRTAGAAGRATWSGTNWVGGAAPLMTDNPGAYIIDVVQSWVDANPDSADEVLAAELVGSNRTTLVDWLRGFIAHRDEP